VQTMRLLKIGCAPVLCGVLLLSLQRRASRAGGPSTAPSSVRRAPFRKLGKEYPQPDEAAQIKGDLGISSPG